MKYECISGYISYSKNCENENENLIIIIRSIDKAALISSFW